MSTILGVSCYYHDAAACLVQDGQLVAAAAEERFNRIKHYSEFPVEAINYVLSAGGVVPDQVDYIAFYDKPFLKFERILASYVATAPRSYRAYLQAMPVWLTHKLRVERNFRKELGLGGELLYGEHHLSHAASAFLVSPFEEAAIMTVDGVGEWATAATGVGRGHTVQLNREVMFPHSLGLYYSALTSYLGFRINDDEWKVMGLAPYGQPTLVDKFRRMLRTHADGSFELDLTYFAHTYSARRAYTDAWMELFGEPPREAEAEITDFHRDVARSGQLVIEEALLNMARALHAQTGSSNLCIAGGVGLNSVANYRLLTETPFERLFIQPAAGDDGGALGVAFFVEHCLLGTPRSYEMRHAYLGPEFSDAEIGNFLRSVDEAADPLPHETLLSETAEAIAASQVVGWFQGRMEFGPRALGNRSILANPTDPRMKDLINSKIKFREAFRPFAPSVHAERAHEYWDLAHESPFMLLVPPVRPEWAAKLPAVTHEDGTGRVQTVERDVNPLYYDLLAQVEHRIGVPVVVNTSFNVRGEPIVCTPRDAYQCFQNTGMDVLVMGSYILRKPGAGSAASPA